MSDQEAEDLMMAFCILNPGDSEGQLVQMPKPRTEGEGTAVIQVLRAGICNTDLEILQGYMGFHGVLGHEFVGIVHNVDSSDEATKAAWIGKRVCGDINVGCNDCGICYKSLDSKCCQMSRNHCPKRTVLGILNRHGTMAEYMTLPLRNLHIVPDGIPDEVAVFAEPLAAACRIAEQGLISYDSSGPDRVAIMGDGKLGLLIAEVLGRLHVEKVPDAPPPILFGKHQHKLDFVKDSGVECRFIDECIDEFAFNGASEAHSQKYDVVIDATGNPAGLKLASAMCRPMGTLILKSTCAAGEEFNAAPFVIDELVVVGSRCGPVDIALEMLKGKPGTTPLNLEKYITKAFPLSQVEDAIQFAAKRSTMKVQVICSEEKEEVASA